jgi:hypothetical protein
MDPYSQKLNPRGMKSQGLLRRELNRYVPWKDLIFQDMCIEWIDLSRGEWT